MQDYIILIGKDLEGAIPGEIQVIPSGNHMTPKGRFILDAADAKRVVAAFEAQKNDMVVDYEHQTLAGVEAPAAGWIKKLVDKGADGLWAVVEWTDRAKRYLANKEYRYVSPVFLTGKTDNRVIRLINVALTNQPNIDGMTPLVNKGIGSGFGAKSSEKQQRDKEEMTMKNLWKLLGLAEDATEDQAIAAVAVLKETPAQVVANKAVLGALGLTETATEAEVTGTIQAMKQSHGTVAELSTQVNSLTAKLAERDAAEAVAGAVKEGKVTPAQKDWAMDYARRDPAGFAVFVSKAPTVIRQGAIVGDDNPPKDGIDDGQRMINKLMGVDDETFKKYAPKED